MKLLTRISKFQKAHLPWARLPWMRRSSAVPEDPLRQEVEALRRQLASVTYSYQQFLNLNEEAKRISSYLAERYQVEIERGDHNGRTLSDVVVFYLGRERTLPRTSPNSIPLSSRPQAPTPVFTATVANAAGVGSGEEIL